MKRLLSIFIVLSLLLSLSITAFALNTEVNDGTSFINTMQSVASQENVTLTQNCIAIPTELYSNMRIVVETDSTTEVEGFICWAFEYSDTTMVQKFKKLTVPYAQYPPATAVRLKQLQGNIRHLL